jgi:ABC-type sugar transport system substrate-binding protein
MNNSNILRTAAALAAATALLAACNGGHRSGGSPAPVVPATVSVPFSTFVQEIFAAPANSAPQVVNGVSINFDVNQDPTAFAALLM